MSMHRSWLRILIFGECPMRWRCAWGLFVLMVCAVSVVAFAQKSPPAKPIDINTATIEHLQELPGVGPVTAQSIVDFREKSGPFRRVEDLLAIRGISETRFKAIAPYVIVSQLKPATAPTAGASKPPVAPQPATAPR